eukprot:TRINITY_DN1019_c0_g2_i5.p1 TRINITY_DN1019_c0_g2~~TRINITY_DN1019_c0_g2_i5.p1  ORF type:complete len:209 (+),score=35.41 TRINITY_DN1019_c0_g2_i5:169-795(+)
MSLCLLIPLLIFVQGHEWKLLPIDVVDCLGSCCDAATPVPNTNVIHFFNYTWSDFSDCQISLDVPTSYVRRVSLDYVIVGGYAKIDSGFIATIQIDYRFSRGTQASSVVQVLDGPYDGNFRLLFELPLIWSSCDPNLIGQGLKEGGSSLFGPKSIIPTLFTLFTVNHSPPPLLPRVHITLIPSFGPHDIRLSTIRDDKQHFDRWIQSW